MRFRVYFEGVVEAFASSFAAGREVTVEARKPDGSAKRFRATIRIDTPQEALYYRHGGILQYVLRQLLGDGEVAEPLSGGIAAGTDRHQTDRGKVTEGSIESFPASDPPAY